MTSYNISNECYRGDDKSELRTASVWSVRSPSYSLIKKFNKIIHFTIFVPSGDKSGKNGNQCSIISAQRCFWVRRCVFQMWLLDDNNKPCVINKTKKATTVGASKGRYHHHLRHHHHHPYPGENYEKFYVPWRKMVPCRSSLAPSPPPSFWIGHQYSTYIVLYFYVGHPPTSCCRRIRLCI